MASISKQSKELQDRHRKILLNMLKLEENRECADCRTRNPTWASINLGIFVCIRCSGLHRQVGTHITKVRSCTMDIWTPEQIAFITKMGNKNAKRIWEHQLPADYGKPSENEDDQLVLQWIRTKYEKKKFMHSNPEAVLMEINAEAKAAEESKKSGGRGGAASGGLGRKTKAVITSPTQLAQKQNQNVSSQQQQPQDNSFTANNAEFTGLDGNVASSFGGGGFGFGGASSENSSNTTSNAAGGGFGFTSTSSATDEQKQNIPSSTDNNNNNNNSNESDAVKAALMKQQEELQKQMQALMMSQQQQQQPTSSSENNNVENATAASSFGSNNNNTGGFTFTATGNDQQQQIGGGFGFVSTENTNTTENLTRAPVSSDEVIDAIFSNKPVPSFQNYVSAASPITPAPTQTGHHQPDPEEAKKKATFDPFSVLANLGQLKQTNLTDVAFPSASASPASPPPSEENASFSNSNPNSQNKFVWGKQDSFQPQETNDNNDNNNDEQQQQQNGFGFTASNDSAEAGGGFGFASQEESATTAEKNENSMDEQQQQPEVTPEAQAILKQLQEQQELLMKQMAQFAAAK